MLFLKYIEVVETQKLLQGIPEIYKADGITLTETSYHLKMG
jgi:hypothetical protein